MSLKCSIFGHRFGDPVVERSRDESGSEVVITIQEIQTCGRCGQERVVSENKEVTTLETPDEVAAESEPDPDPAEPASAPESAPESPPPADDGATILEDEEPVVQEAEPESDEAPTADDLTEPPAEEPSSTDDDGIILEDDETAADDAERDPGQWPDEPDDDSPEWEPPTDIEDTAEPDPDPDPEPSPRVEPVGEAVTVPDGTFRCPNCGFTTPVESSSLREGDFCPECHTGSLAHEAE